jgi:hypothetical protein
MPSLMARRPSAENIVIKTKNLRQGIAGGFGGINIK